MARVQRKRPIKRDEPLYTTKRQILTIFEEALVIDAIKYQTPTAYKGHKPSSHWIYGWSDKKLDPILDQFDHKKIGQIEKQLDTLFKDFDWDNVAQELARIIRKTNFPIMWGLGHLICCLYGKSCCRHHVGSWHKRYAGRVDTLTFYEFCIKKWNEYCKRVEKAKR
ncbi:hypothetical protein HOS33_gp217 [Erwinia phage vB_EamM_Y3]|uniref:Uncharacterized protein n=1 Tax=Erwinia phage vB_EamM_Y3 TaxID=1983553 RepID=A0A2H4IBC8_9CAUD|nr:hypothetical protein HOS33_gp217 [Erwinia phage vB_EamM_Y3]ARW58857.1 hypothetical protein Y3_217 [Erwinia phage vB_EamM_Y3]